MRSSYAVADELDFMPMDEFQKEQFLFRQSEWDGYRSQIKVTQGELTDPAYFDFISFCQYASIAQGMRNGRLLFEGATQSPRSHVDNNTREWRAQRVCTSMTHWYVLQLPRCRAHRC
jgi:hypothetical protein